MHKPRLALWLLLATIAISMLDVLPAQSVRVLGDLTTTNNLAPFNLTAYQSCRYQSAYSAAEMNFPGGRMITQIRIHGANVASGVVYGNLRLRLAHSSLTPLTITTTFDTNYTAPLTTVIGPTNFAPTSSPGQNNLLWWSFPLTTPFFYNGVDTLLVDWSYESITGTGFNISSAAGRNRAYIRPAPQGYLEPTALTFGDSGNHGIEFTVLDGPTLTATAAAGSQLPVYSNSEGTGGNGIAAGEFSISSTLAGASLTHIAIQAGGTGDDQSDYSYVALWRDSNASNAFEAGGDTLIGTAAAAFPADNGMLNFNVPAGAEQDFGATDTRKYFIVVKLNGAASPSETFNFVVQDITVTGTNAAKAGVPSAVMAGLIVQAPVFTFADGSAPAAASAFLGSTNNVCQKFSLSYSAGPDNRPDSITITTLGTGNDAAHVTMVSLWRDDGNGTFESATDSLVDSGVFAQDNGSVVFDVSGELALVAPEIRTFFVTYDFNLLPLHSQTFRSYVSAAAGGQFGATFAGLPAPGIAGTPGLQISAVVLTAVMNGPGSALTVDNNSAGTTGAGELLLDFTLEAKSGANWNVGSLVFAASGTAAHNAAYQTLALHEDSGNGIWDGASTDGAAAGTLVSFGPGPGFQATFALSNDFIAAGATRRFFLTGRLAGTATSGQTLNARLESITSTPPAGGTQLGFPTAASTALIIDESVLTVSNAPGGPGNQLHKSGTALPFVMAKFRLGASNDTVSVSGVTLTGTGNGNWTTSMSNTDGVQVYRDNGDGIFDAGTDTLLYQGAGQPSMNATFTPSLDVPVRGTRDIWVRANLLASAGSGAASQQSFTVSIVQGSDVACTVPTVLIGSPAPNGAILNVVDFFVTSVDPLSDAPAGGKQLTITGSGFMSPFTVTIDGVVCPGTPTITPTMVTGIQVPPGSGTGKTIVVSSGTLAPLTLTDTFAYVAPGGGKAPSSGGGCIAGATSGLAMLALPMLALIRRRRK